MAQILVINTGSSSLKFHYIDTQTSTTVAKGLIGRIGEEEGQRVFTSDALSFSDQKKIIDHTHALEDAFETLASSGYDVKKNPPAAVGHRVVIGGTELGEPTLIDNTVIKTLKDCIPLAPLHNPGNILGIETCQKLLPGVPQVAVFDTGFFKEMPAESQTYAIPSDLAHKHGIRRYGFHGTSHEYVSRQAALFTQRRYEDLHQIVFHIGNGASVSAVKKGKAIDTSMGLTPLEGLVMGTRSGDVDPALVSYLAHCENSEIDEVISLLNKESGLKGICGENDLRKVRQLQEEGHEAADIAIKVYVHRMRKYLGAYWLELGTVDHIVFTAGAGENAPWLRSLVLQDLESWGVHVDSARNNSAEKGDRIITADDSSVKALVIPTNEELMIALSTEKIISA